MSTGSPNTGDTIAAVATGSGKAGIGIVRVSGPQVHDIARAMTGLDLQPRHAHYLTFSGPDGETLDQGIAILYESPNSFTGESVLELQGHGGAVVLDMVLSRVIELGARAARPGEFSERAFHNEKLDLAQAEAVSDLIQSSSKAAARAAVRSMSGEFSSKVHNINEELIALRVWLEAALDFSEEDIDFLAGSDLRQRASGLIEAFDALMARAEQGQRLRDGLSIVITGVTNAGKSSLLNLLAGQEAAIVTPIAGTTRDVVHSDIVIDGLPLHVVDTAGVRQTDDVVEQLGIERAKKAVQDADHVLLLIDATEPCLPDGLSLPASRTTTVINKSDKVTKDVLNKLMCDYQARFSLSVITGDGVTPLRHHLISIAGHDSSVEGVFSARRRHIDALNTARQATVVALQRLEENNFPELAAEELRLAQQALEMITGRFDSEDLLGEIFSSFCVGK